MNKPDFESQSKTIYPTERRQKAFQAGCEHVWNTHVVPLQQDWWDLKKRFDESNQENDDFSLLIEKLESENKALREEINALNVDIQSYRNGHEANAKRYNDLLIERNKLKEEIERLKAEVLKEKFPEN